MRATISHARGTTVTSVRYVDNATLRPSLVATPGKMRAFVYDANGNVTGYSEFDTSDSTGERGFDATTSGIKLTVGAVYDVNNRLKQATFRVNEVKTEHWVYTTDETGNLQIAQELVSNWLLGEFDRDASNRVTRITGNDREARFAYDKRGRITRFTYSEDATIRTAGLKRFLTVDYAYTPDGRVASRVGSVSKNGGNSQPVTADEIDRWIGNYESGIDPAGPPAGASNLQKSVIAGTSITISPVCAECYVFAKAKLAWKLFYRQFTLTTAGQPVSNDVPELQVAAQEQVPFPILMPEQTDQSKRAVLYAKIFRGDDDADSGFNKCAYGKPISKRCREVTERCIDKCHVLFQTSDYGITFFRCKNACMADNGC